MKRKLAAILAVDVVGYTRLMEQDEAGTLAALRERREGILEPLIAEHNGRVVMVMGDGALVEFASAVNAVACAVELQKRMGAQNDGVAVDRRIVLRVGVNLGDVVVEGDDLLGDGVNIAARLEQLCEPGDVLISGTAYDHLQGKLDLHLDYAGEQRVKNISRPVRVYRARPDSGGQPWRLRARQHYRRMLVAAAVLVALLLAGGGIWLTRPIESASGKSSIAVLPFDNMGADDATGRLADGITEDIITDLARFREIDVIARDSTLVYKGKPANIRQIGHDLNVRYVLEGSIQRQNDRVRVTAQLIDAASDADVWTDRWDRPVTDIFAVQTELAEQVSSRLGGNLGGMIVAADRNVAMRKRPTDLTAYDLYVLGGEALRPYTKEGTDEAIRLLKRSIEIDPKFARAWARLAWAYLHQSDWGTDDTPAARTLRVATARRALELDPQDADAHAAYAEMLGYAGDLVQSEIEFDKALDLNPNSADNLAYYAGTGSTFGKPEKGAEAADRAMRLNPNTPSWALGLYRAAYFMAGRYEDALRIHLRRPKENYGRWDYLFAAIIPAELGRLEEARAAVAEYMARFPETSIEGWIGTPNWSNWERQRMNEAMRKAGFPACANKDVLAAAPDLVRLPECMKP
jgi:TolB-like protein/class 3 adenylate cyclase